LLPEVIQSHVLPFENLVVQSYLQMWSSLMDQLHEKEFILLQANIPLDVMRAHCRFYVDPITKVSSS
jgi:hypothetical protein